MLLSVIIIVLLGLVAYFHFAQGLFAATVSAVCAGIAALMAFSYHETVNARYTGGGMAAYGNAVILVGLFALIYIILRVVVDNMMPGNVRYPVALDKIGAAVMGLVAGFFGTAIIAIAAQELPFGPKVLMYSPYPTEDIEIVVPRYLSQIYGIEQGEDTWNFDQISELKRIDTPEAAEARQELWLPVDTWFLSLVSKLSDQGALAGQRFDDVYPDFKTATFGHRLGMQRAATQVALNLQEGKEQVTVPYVFRATTEGDNAQFPGGIPQAAGDTGNHRTVDANLRPSGGTTLLVLRVNFASAAADDGGYVRFSPGTCRLVIAGRQYYPIATLDSGRVAVHHLPDDYLLAQEGADLIYEVETGSAIVNENELAAGAFFEFKRFGRVDLSGKRIYSVITQSPLTHVLRKYLVQEAISQRVAEGRPMERQASRVYFTELRNSVPEEAPDPETAERAAAGLSGEGQEAGEGDETTQPTGQEPAGEEQPATDESPDGGADPGGP